MFKKKTNAKVSNGVADIMTKLDDIYTNKSGDEYKISGDITKSPVYDKIQRMTADLTLLDGYSKMDADELKKMFEEFKAKPSEEMMTKLKDALAKLKTMLGIM